MEEIVQVWLLHPITGKLASAAALVLAILVGVRLIKKSLSRYVEDSELRYRLRKAVNVVGAVVALIGLTSIFSVRFSQFTVAFGVAGAGVAFALQEVIASVAGWLAVSFGKFYRPGDRIQLGGIRGDVIDVGVLRTTLMECGQWVNADLYNGRIVRVANSFVFKEPVFNYSGDFPFLWDEIMVPIKYGSDYRLARRILERVGEEVVGDYARAAEEAWRQVAFKYMIEHATVKPTVSLIANQNWLEYTLRYVVDYKLRRATKDALFSRILEEIDQVADRVGIAASTLNIEKLAPLEVKLTGMAARPAS